MATTNKNYLVEVHKGLTNSIEKQASALPDGFNKQRFIQNCMTVLQDGQTDFSKCEPNSVIRTLLKGALLGLDFFNGECYAIPFGGKVQFLTDYRGEVKLCKRYASNPILDIYAKLVKEGDEFTEEIRDGKQYVNFKPKPFNDGEIIGAFAVCLYKDGGMVYDTMSKADIEKTRKAFSKAANSKAWVDSYGEMCKKTVLRRLCKVIDLNFDTTEQIQAFDDGGDMDVNKPVEVPEAVDVYADVEVVDAEVVETEHTELPIDAKEADVSLSKDQ